ncbi:DUF11 domain-containing protein [Prochlorothrix hollandica]|uniref:DUF11 domain-containing protein n=1 Tax=Prochlorothrix hollandica PCC 9006 = CALU 1027 TaxID=317619 RepID=A0A0M2PUU6_PROHO|nr:DUF11 domain-containing protein [Prochlorothrix hollandica]KKJ00281.1 hypothetical protein PROH_11390 [Prochlorothrix hollandica PCC 9006 = CALU 1027]
MASRKPSPPAHPWFILWFLALWTRIQTVLRWTIATPGWLGRWVLRGGQGAIEAGLRPYLHSVRQTRQRQRERRRRWWRKNGPLKPIDQLLGLWGIRPVEWRRWLKRSSLFLFTCVFTLLFTGILGWFLLPAGAADPGNVVFVKRITAVNTTDITGFVEDATTNDNEPDWPSPNTTYLRGEIGNTGLPNGGVQPGDELEYTIYFLSNGGSDVRDVKFCDLIPANTTYVTGSMRLGYDATNTTLPDPSGTGTVLTDADDAPTDGAVFYAGGTTPPTICTNANANGGNDNDPSTNDTGAAFVQIVDAATPMPAATGAGTPISSYGFVRFRVKVVD